MHAKKEWKTRRLRWYTWLYIQHFLLPCKYHSFVTSNEILQAQHFSIPQGLIKTSLRNLCNLPVQNRYLYTGHFLQLTFMWSTHLGVSLHTACCSMIRWYKAALNISINYRRFKRPKTATALEHIPKHECVTELVHSSPTTLLLETTAFWL